MAHTLTYKNNILDALGALNVLSLPESIRSVYEKYVTDKIDEAVLKLRGAQYYVQGFSPENARQELETLKPLLDILLDLKGKFEEKQEAPPELKVKITALCEVMEELYEDLQDIGEYKAPYNLSQPVLGKDWDRSEDDHWDDY